MCEEFGCLPSQALREWESAPCELIETIVQFRVYARSYATWHGATEQAQIPADLPFRSVIEALVSERVMAP